MLDFESGGTRNLGVVYKNFMPYRYHASLREALLQWVRGRQPSDDKRILKILQFFSKKNINFDEKMVKLFKNFSFVLGKFPYLMNQIEISYDF